MEGGEETWTGVDRGFNTTLVTAFSEFIVILTLPGLMLFVVFVFVIYPIRKILKLTSVSNSSTISTWFIAVCCISTPLLVCALYILFQFIIVQYIQYLHAFTTWHL